MPSFQEHLLNSLSLLACLGNTSTDEHLLRIDDGFQLLIDNKPIVEINREGIFLAETNVTDKIRLPDNADTSINVTADQLTEFFYQLGKSAIRLNHLGINYTCSNTHKEVSSMQRTLAATGLRLYEEASPFQSQRWLFIGDTQHWEEPLFELAVTEKPAQLTTEWIPHFQIDIDTDLQIAELEKLTSRCLGTDFIAWRQEDPEYGTIDIMGELARINGSKLYLCIGTDKRNTKFHRENILRVL